MMIYRLTHSTMVLHGFERRGSRDLVDKYTSFSTPKMKGITDIQRGRTPEDAMAC